MSTRHPAFHLSCCEESPYSVKGGLRPPAPAAGGRKRPSSPGPSDNNERWDSETASMHDPVPLTNDCSVTARSVKGAGASHAIEQVRPLTHRPLTRGGDYRGDGVLSATLADDV